MSVPATHFPNTIVHDILNSCWFLHSELRFEYPVAKTQLPLTIVTKGVQLASRGDQSWVQVTGLDLWDWVWGLEIQELGIEEGAGRVGVLATLALGISAPSVNTACVCEDQSVVRATRDLLPVNSRLEHAGD